MVITRELCGCYKGQQQEFYKVLDLEDLGLVIYCHSLCREGITQPGVVGSSQHTTEDVCVILHNTKDVKLTPAEFIPALEKKDISCPRCRLLFERAHKLLQNVISIDKQNIMGVCDHCLRKAQSKRPCDLCTETVKKYLSMQDGKKDDMKRYIKLWLSKMRHVVKDKDAVHETTKKANFRAYSDVQLNELCQLSPKATREIEIKQMFHTNFHKSDSNIYANLPDLEETEKKKGKAVIFNESFEPYVIAPYAPGIIDTYRQEQSDITIKESDSIQRTKPLKPIIHEIPKIAPWEQETKQEDDDISVIKEVIIKLERDPSSRGVSPHDSSGTTITGTSSTYVKVTPRKRHLPTPESDSELYDTAKSDLGKPKRKKKEI